MKDTDLNNKPMVETSRRRFLKKIWGGLGIIAGMEMMLIIGSFFSPSKKNVSSGTNNLVETGNVSDFKLDSVFPFRSGKFYLVRMSDGGFVALSLKCSHLGCSVLWNDETRKFECPCHSSSFDLTGNVINPPAPRPLDSYPVIIEEGKVKVNIGKPIKRFRTESTQITYA